MALSESQQAHVNAVFSECRAQIAEYLTKGVEVAIYLQNECGGDVPPYAVAPHDNQEFWLGCWDTSELAAAGTEALGLLVASQ